MCELLCKTPFDVVSLNCISYIILIVLTVKRKKEPLLMLGARVYN